MQALRRFADAFGRDDDERSDASSVASHTSIAHVARRIGLKDLTDKEVEGYVVDPSQRAELTEMLSELKADLEARHEAIKRLMRVPSDDVLDAITEDDELRAADGVVYRAMRPRWR